MQEPQIISTDELTESKQPTKMEILQAEVREYNRLAKAQHDKKRAQRKRSKVGKRNNRKKK